MNVSTGTFGGGIPYKCTECGANPLEYEHVKDTWTFTKTDTGEEYEY